MTILYKEQVFSPTSIFVFTTQQSLLRFVLIQIVRHISSWRSIMKNRLSYPLLTLAFLSLTNYIHPMTPYSSLYEETELEYQTDTGKCYKCKKSCFESDSNNYYEEDSEKNNEVYVCQKCYVLFHQECIPYYDKDCSQCLSKDLYSRLTPIKKTFNLATISQLNVDLANAKWGKLGNNSCSFVAHNIEYILQVMANTRYGKSILDKDVDFAVEQELLTNFYGQKNIMTEFEHKKRAIFLAILLNDQERVKGILDKEDESSKDLLVNCLDYDESTPLHYAARHGNEEMIKILRQYNALIKKNKRGGTPVMSILIRNFDPELKKRLISAFNCLQSIQGSDDKNLINLQNNNNN
jgi:hypothetical protein